MARQLPAGRKRIPLEKIESQSNLEVTFSKRRYGVFRKASELHRLCNSDVAVVIFSPQDKNIYAFGEPSVEPVLKTFMDKNRDEQNTVAAHLMEDYQDSVWAELDEQILDNNQNPNEQDAADEHSEDDVDGGGGGDEWVEINEEEKTGYYATIEAEKTRGKAIAYELPNYPSQEDCSEKWWLGPEEAPEDDLSLDKFEKMLANLELFKHSLDCNYRTHTETSSSMLTNEEVPFVVPQGGGFPSTPHSYLAYTYGSPSDRGNAPMQD